MNVITLFTGVTTNTTTSTVYLAAGNLQVNAYRVYQATVSGTGAVTATITYFGSVDGVNYSATAFATITLSGTTAVTDNFASTAPWPYVRCVTASVTGTGATVSSIAGL